MTHKQTLHMRIFVALGYLAFLLQLGCDQPSPSPSKPASLPPAVQQTAPASATPQPAVVFVEKSLTEFTPPTQVPEILPLPSPYDAPSPEPNRRGEAPGSELDLETRYLHQVLRLYPWHTGKIVGAKHLEASLIWKPRYLHQVLRPYCRIAR